MGRVTFKFGLNRHFTGKPSKTATINYAINWEPSEVTAEELIAHIRQGFAFTAQFRDSYRKTANFICSDFVAADFDGTMTLDEAQALPFVRQHCSFLYTTPSHTTDHHRFRAVFLLDETITDAKVWADCLYGLAIRLGSDRSIKDAGRMFFGSPDCEVIQIGGRLPAHEVDKLTILAHDERSRSRHPSALGAAIASSLKLGADQRVRTKDGKVMELEKLAPNTSVACPYHADEHPSAFVVRSNRGSNGIHCMACNATFWKDSGSPPYDFSVFERLVDDRRAKDNAERQVLEQDDNPFVAFFPPEPNVSVLQTKFLPPLDYRAGITVIKSPKGSGKTEALAALIDQIRKDQFPAKTAKVERPKSVLLIGHRQSLIKEAANRLGLECYLDDEDKGTHRRRRYGYAICLDSLHKIAMGAKGTPPSQYDVIILDESEQVISHLLSETLRDRVGMPAAFASLEFMIRRAKAVYTLDADLGLITLHAMRDLRPDDWGGALRIIYNQPQVVTERRLMKVFQSKKDLQNRMLDAIREGKRCFIASNSKATVELLEQLIRKEFGSSLKMVAITSDNSRGKFETHFVQNIQTEFLKVQVLICSPSLGTGIDISFPDGRCEVHEVFGFFSPHVNKHTDIDQQLARVRNPGAVSVWFDAGGSNYETSLDVVRRQLALANYVPTAINGLLDDDGNPSFNEADPLLNIAAHVMVAQRSSQNKIVSLFERLRQSNGWEIVTWAVFGDFTFDLTERLSLSVGGRYTHDQRKAEILRQSYLGGGSKIFGGLGLAYGAPGTDFSGGSTFTKFTPRASLSFKPTPDHNFYASYSQGFKGGGFDPRGVGTNAPDLNEDGVRSDAEVASYLSFRPEKVDSYEVGYKGNLFDGALYIALSGFYADYTDVQIPGSVACTDGNGNSSFCGIVSNAGKARFKGIELEGNARLARDLFSAGDKISLSGSAGLIDAKYTKFLANINSQPTEVSAYRKVQNTPKYTASGTLSYETPVGDGQINLSTTVSYRSKTYQFELPNPYLDQAGYALWDASLVYTAPEGRWTLGVHGKNVLNKRYKTSGYTYILVDALKGTPALTNNLPTATLGKEGTLTTYYGNPRQVFVTATLKF